MASVYILFFESTNGFYVGFTNESVLLRTQRHNEDYYNNKFTARGKPWSLYLEVKCSSVEQAQLIEKHIKKMKSKVYITNLKQYPEMVEKLLHKYINC